MIKGCQKKIIHIRNTDCPYFEEAYFILKSEGDTLPPEDDIIKEAVRITKSTSPSKRSRLKRTLEGKLSLILAGAGAVSLLFGTVILFSCL